MIAPKVFMVEATPWEVSGASDFTDFILDRLKHFPDLAAHVDTNAGYDPEIGTLREEWLQQASQHDTGPGWTSWLLPDKKTEIRISAVFDDMGDVEDWRQMLDEYHWFEVDNKTINEKETELLWQYKMHHTKDKGE